MWWILGRTVRHRAEKVSAQKRKRSLPLVSKPCHWTKYIAEDVAIDQIRPDWEDQLNAVKAAAARRASRRIIMHRVGLASFCSVRLPHLTSSQIGDRLIPVGYTSSREGTNVSVGDSGPIERTVDENTLQAILAGAERSSRSGRRSRRTGSGDANSGIAAAADIEEVSQARANSSIVITACCHRITTDPFLSFS
jgi:hypothetical protein